MTTEQNPQPEPELLEPLMGVGEGDEIEEVDVREFIECPFCQMRYGKKIKEIVKHLHNFYNRFIKAAKETRTILLNFTEYRGIIEHLSYNPHTAALWVVESCVGADDNPRLLQFIKKLLENLVVRTLIDMANVDEDDEVEIAEQAERIATIMIPREIVLPRSKYGSCVIMHIDIDAFNDFIEKYIN